jgi:hypothetical protein
VRVSTRSFASRFDSGSRRRAGHHPPQPGQPLQARQSPHLERQRHVLRHRHVRIERVALEHHRDVAVLRCEGVDGRAVDPHLALVGVVQAREDPQQRRLAAARRADQRQELAVADLEVDAVEHARGAEALPDAGEGDRRHAGQHRRPMCRGR